MNITAEDINNYLGTLLGVTFESIIIILKTFQFNMCTTQQLLLYTLSKKLWLKTLKTGTKNIHAKHVC